jgi:hypothetical protein
VRVRHLPAREHTRAAALYPPASIPAGEKSCPCPHPADIRGYRVYPHPPPLPFSTRRCSCLPHAPPLPWALPPPLPHASCPSKPARPLRLRPSSSLSWPLPPPCRGRHQIRPSLLTSVPAHECLSSSARAPPEEIRRWGVELTTYREWSWRGKVPCAARGDPPVRLAAVQYVRERRTGVWRRD